MVVQLGYGVIANRTQEVLIRTSTLPAVVVYLDTWDIRFNGDTFQFEDVAGNRYTLVERGLNERGHEVFRPFVHDPLDYPFGDRYVVIDDEIPF